LEDVNFHFVNEKVCDCAIFGEAIFLEKIHPAFCYIFPVNKISLDNHKPWLPILNTAELIIKNEEVDVRRACSIWQAHYHGYMGSVLLSLLFSAIYSS